MSHDVTLVKVIGMSRNTWMPGFGFASHHIASAIVDGHVTEDDVRAFDLRDSIEPARVLARKAGLEFRGDEPTGANPHASGYQVDAEDVEISIDAIRALRDDCFTNSDASWQFYTDEVDGQAYVEEFAVSVEALERLRAESVKTYTDAARLIVEGDASWRESVR